MAAVFPDACRLVCAVHDRDQDEAHAVLGGLDRTTLMALAVALADMVPDDAPTVTVPRAPWKADDEQIYRVAALIACSEYDVEPDALTAQSQKRDVAHARQLCWWLCRQRGLSYPVIGALASRDHTTVMSGVKALQKHAVRLERAQWLLQRGARVAA